MLKRLRSGMISKNSVELKRHRDSLTDAMEQTRAKSLGDFGSVLQHRQGCSFDARPNEIVVGREQRMVARVEPTQIEWQTVSRSINRLCFDNRSELLNSNRGFADLK